MTIQEMYLLIGKIVAYYPRFCDKYDNSKIKLMAESWHELLYDLPFELCVKALQKHVLDTEKGCFVPNVGEIRRNAMNICDSDTELTGSEAWGEVTKAIRQYGQYNTEKALESMSEITRKVVKHIGYREICFTDNIGVIRGQFLKMYEHLLKRENDKKISPKGFIEQFNRLLGSAQNKMISYKEME
jgi:hypothetical protein